MAAGTLTVFARAHALHGIAHARTMAFTTMAMFQVFNAFNCRSRDKSIFQSGLFSNRYLLVAMAASVLLQLGTTLLPSMQRAFGTTALSLDERGIVVLVSSTSCNAFYPVNLVPNAVPCPSEPSSEKEGLDRSGNRSRPDAPHNRGRVSSPRM
jgi:magnesium-transporting ATPase (P-type)